MNLRRIDGMQIDADPRFQRREWRAQTVGWALMALLVLAAFVGLFGEGPVSHAEASPPEGGLAVRYERFARRHGETWLEIETRGGETARMEVWLSRAYAERVILRTVVPDPLSQRSDGERVIYVFEAAPGQAFKARFQLEADEIGPYPARIGIVGGPSVSVRQFVYP